MKMREFTAPAVLGAILVALAGTARADTEGMASFGSQWWNQNNPEATYEEFRQVPLGGLLESFYLRSGQEKQSLLLYGTHGLQSDQSTGLTWQQGARWRLDLGYAQTPHVFSRTARSPFSVAEPGVFTLPDTLQATVQNIPASLTSAQREAYYRAVMNDLLANAPRVPLEFRTDVARARLRARADRHWSFELRGTRRDRSGTKAFGTPFGFSSAIEVPMPISTRTVDADAVVEYRRERLTVQGGFGVSAFKNKVDRLLVDNTKRLTDRTYGSAYSPGDGSARGQLDLAPDNQAIRGNVALNMSLPRRSALNATVAVTQAKQDDAWLPHTVNTAITSAGADTLAALKLPGTNADAEALLLVQDVRLTGRPWSRVAGTVRVHNEKYDNKTAAFTFPGYVRMDQVFEDVEVKSKAFGNSQLVTGVDVDVDVVPRATVGGTYEFRRREHTRREIEEDDENTFAGRLRVRPTQDVSLRAEYRHASREGSGLILHDYENAAGTLIEQPGLRRFDVADRTQDRARGEVSWTAAPWLLLGAGYDWLHNDYEESKFGLRDEERQLVNAMGTVNWNDRVFWNVGGGLEQVATDQQSRTSGATVDTTAAGAGTWTANLRDRNGYLFTSADWWAKPDKLSLGVAYTYNRARGAYSLWGLLPAPPVGNLPDTKYETQDLMLEARWRLRQNLAIAGRYGFERFDVSDFASENVPLLNVAGTSSNPVPR
jgi:MtrB/PioB family decaheme-associated outer membrane protein